MICWDRINAQKLGTVVCTALLLNSAVLAQQSGFMEQALATEQWLQQLEQRDQSGIYWPDVKDSLTSHTDLYAGNSGVVLFYLGLYRQTADPKFRDRAEASMRHMLALKPAALNEENTGLYTGLAGMIYTLHQVYLASGKKEFRKPIAPMLQMLSNRMLKGDRLDLLANDIVYGYAGVGLTYLYAAKHGLLPEAMADARQMGDILLRRAQLALRGIRWPMFMQDTARQFYMPNFSHGTAGTAYFLACLFEQTKDRRYLDAAMQAAEHLQSIANADGFVYHAEPSAEARQRFYLSWCHGPVGTARLYFKLFQLTGAAQWKNSVDQMAAGLMHCGIPEKRTAGYWNNVGSCCGTAGIAEFYLSLYAQFRDPRYMEFAERMLRDLVGRATVSGVSLSWLQSEHRSRPDLLQFQTGLMQGAAGIGLTFLHHEALRTQKPFLIRLPDDPF